MQIYAQNAIRKKNEALNYMRLGSRLDAVVSRLDSQAKMQVSFSSRHTLAAMPKLADGSRKQWICQCSTLLQLELVHVTLW